MLFLLNIVLAFLWAALTADFRAENIAIGFIFSFGILALTSKVWGSKPYAKKSWLLIKFIAFIFWEILVSNFRVASDVLRLQLKNRPGVIAIPLDAKTDIEITLIANLISLTPGTLTLDVSTDKSLLFIHTMFTDDIQGQRDALKADIEKRILRICE